MTREEAIRILASSCISGSKQTEALETLIPELRESEDERIRKDIINLIYWLKSNPSLCSQYYKDRYDGILTWLEKQKKQKQEWSESDKQNINLIISYLDSYIKEHNDTFGADECKSLKYWLKSICPNQSKSEWSEEDRLHYANVLEALEYVKGCKSDYDKIEAVKSDIAWFKSLRPSWKPSEEQDYSSLSDLERAIHRGFLCADVENVPVAIVKETAKEVQSILKAEG